MTARGSAESAIKTIEEGEEHTSNISTEREILKRRSEREGCALAHTIQVYRRERCKKTNVGLRLAAWRERVNAICARLCD